MKKSKLILACLAIYCNIQSINLVLISIPKAGTHLLNKAIKLMFKMKHIRGFLDNSIIVQEEFDLLSRKPNSFIQKHLVHKGEHAKLFRENKIKGIFIYRDPRDQIVSLSNYAIKTGMWPKLSRKDIKYNINYLIQDCSIIGPTNPILKHAKGIDDYYNYFLPWANETDIVYATSFEKLVGPRGGGSLEAQLQELKNIAQHLGIKLTDKQIRDVAQNVFGSSQTFHKGIIGQWKQHFDESVKNLFKQYAGQLLIDLEYENNLIW